MSNTQFRSANDRSHRAGKRAFSLVEVTFAVAIVAIAITVLLGLFPAGIKNARDSVDSTVATSIAQDIISTVQAEAANNFTNALLTRFGTFGGTGTPTTTVYSALPISTISSVGATIINTGTYRFNFQSPVGLGASISYHSGSTTQPFIFFFDRDGRLTSDLGTSTGMAGLPRRLPYFRAEMRVINNPTPTTSATLSRVIVQVRWPVYGTISSSPYVGLSGRRLRYGGPLSTGTFTDQTVTYFTEITQIK